VVVVIALGLPPAYVLLKLTVRVLQERTRA
jgi:hypothetical protein